MHILTEADVATLVDADDAYRVVSDGLVRVARGTATMFPPLVGRGSDPATRFGVKAGVDPEAGGPGLKVGSYWPANRARNLPAHGSTTLLIDDATGFPTALVAATRLNALRTAAADAVAVDRLARPEARVLAIVGAGNQSWFELEAIRRVRPIAQVRIWNRSGDAAAALAERAVATGLDARATTLPDAVSGADIVVTATASRVALVERDWIAPGTHISAMGADGLGKQELDPALVAAARLFADLPSQSSAIGEFQHAVAAGAVDPTAIIAIGDVIAGQVGGRQNGEEITIFDSSGIAIQDLAIARLAIERATARRVGQRIDFGPG